MGMLIGDRRTEADLREELVVVNSPQSNKPSEPLPDVRLTIVDASQPYVRRISPSQLELHGRCERRWAFVHRAKREEPFTGAAQAGSETHSVLEHQGPWDTEWTAPDTGKTYPVGQMARLLQAQTPDGVTAREKRWEFELEGLPFVCITDFLSEEIVGDYKTTSRIRNAKSKEKLLEDPQRLLNSAVVPTAKQTTWLYGAWDTMLVTARECEIDREADKQRLHLKVLKPAEKMLNTPDDVDPLSVKPNVNDCMLFPPLGCPFKNECFPPGKLKPVVTNSKESNEAMQSLIERLRAKSAANGNEPVPAALPSAPDANIDMAYENAVSEALQAKAELKGPAVLYADPAPAAEPVRRGRKPKAVEAPAEPVAALTPEAPKPAPADQQYLVNFLYIDCLPLTHAFENASKYIAEAAQEAADDLHIPHVLLADFGKGAPALAAQLRANLSGKFIEHLYLETRSAEGKACIGVLSACAHTVVKGLF